MTTYTLTVSQWMFHYWGTVKAEHPPLCCGNTTHFGFGRAEGGECDNGHALPVPVKWDVEKDWDHDRLRAWAKANWPDPGPQQFDQEDVLEDRAIMMFLDGMRDPHHPERWQVEPAKQGDILLNDQGEIIAECNRG